MTERAIYECDVCNKEERDRNKLYQIDILTDTTTITRHVHKEGACWVRITSFLSILLSGR